MRGLAGPVMPVTVYVPSYPELPWSRPKKQGTVNILIVYVILHGDSTVRLPLWVADTPRGPYKWSAVPKPLDSGKDSLGSLGASPKESLESVQKSGNFSQQASFSRFSRALSFLSKFLNP